MRDAFVCTPMRTPVGRYGGSLRDVSAQQLAGTVIKAVLSRTALPLDEIDDVVLGQCYPSGEAPAIGRVAGLDAGLPVTVPGLQLDRRCGSGLQAVVDAAMRVQTDVADVVIAGGVESMSQVEHYLPAARWGLQGDQVLLDRLARGRITAGGRHHPVEGGMLETAENLRAEYSISRDEQDRLAVESHRRASEATTEGRFDSELVPVVVEARGSEELVEVDEHVRPGTTIEQLAALRPARIALDPDATVTAGNASGQNDGAAACVVASADAVERHGLLPLARLRSWAVAGVPPHLMGIGPVPATERALSRAGLTLDDMDLIELNEAFAAQALAVLRVWGMDGLGERVNVNGSGISLGHPVGATGCRILATMLWELDRRKGRWALETMCIGGGQGMAAIFERVT